LNEFYVYILKCNDDSYYIGQTDNIERRIAEHDSNSYDCYTSTRLPIKVMFVQTFGTRAEALDSERQLKKWSRKKKEALIEQDWSQVSLLGKKKFN
jgi:predicted GIY-YIG superfamily endonuclease